VVRLCGAKRQRVRPLNSVVSCPRVNEKVIGVVGFVVVVASFIINQVLGWRVLGAEVIAWGLWSIWKRRIPYGVEGREPSGHLTGWAAVVVGIVQALIGAVFIAAAEVLAAGGGGLG
jgi:hypothetical protein